MKNIAIIPARIGSKRIPKKNIKNFLGSPIISYPIKAALQSNIFDEIIVSTDSLEILDLAQELGLDHFELRPSALSDDHTPTAPVVEHAVRHLSKYDEKNISSICCIYPTSVFVTSEILKDAYNKIRSSSNNRSCYSVLENDSPILRSQRVNQDGFLEMLWPEHELSRTQDLEPTYKDAGQFYFMDACTFLKEKKCYLSDSMPYLLNKYQAHDIDTSEDWIFAELLYKNMQNLITTSDIDA
jgi:pseudaminic acid cytidylyltransferase